MITNPKSKWSTAFRMSLNRISSLGDQEAAQDMTYSEWVRAAGHDSVAVQNKNVVVETHKYGWQNRNTAVF